MQGVFANSTRRQVLRTAGALAYHTSMPRLANSQDSDTVRLSLEFRIYGGNAPLFLGLERGIFAEQGIDAGLDGSAGSVESVTRVATGTHAFGMADLSTLVEFTARNPKEAPKLIMPVFDRFPAVI